MFIPLLRIDEDLVGFLSRKEDVRKYINSCIREAKRKERKKRSVVVSEDYKERGNIEKTCGVFLPDEEIENKENPFYKQKVVITGELEMFRYRNDLAVLLHSWGAAVTKSISGATDIVVTGDNPGPKKIERIKEERAKGHCVRVITEEELEDILHECGFDGVIP